MVWHLTNFDLSLHTRRFLRRSFFRVPTRWLVVKRRLWRGHITHWLMILRFRFNYLRKCLALLRFRTYVPMSDLNLSVCSADWGKLSRLLKTDVTSFLHHCTAYNATKWGWYASSIAWTLLEGHFNLVVLSSKLEFS